MFLSFLLWYILWNIDNIVISKLVETKNNFNHLVGYLDEVM